MSQKALRSPQFVNVAAVAGSLSTVLGITIDGVLRYRIIKNTTPLQVVQFEWAELARDYLSISFDGTYAVQQITVRLGISGYSGINGTGTPVDPVVLDTTVKAVDGFGTFMEGSNPAIPFPSRTAPAWLTCVKSNIADIDSEIFAPVGVAGKLGYMLGASDDYQLSYEDYNETDIVIGGEGEITQVLKINRVDCTKYGQGTKFTFINKYGMLQDIWFFLKNIKRLNRTTESFQRNTLTNIFQIGENNYYDVNEAPKKHFNTEGTQSNIFNSGYYPEEANCMFEELLLSNHVWMTRPSTSGSGEEVVPVMVKSSDLVYKTSLNDKLIEYTVEFEDAFDYINNVR